MYTELSLNPTRFDGKSINELHFKFKRQISELEHNI